MLYPGHQVRIWSDEHRAWWRPDAHGYTTVEAKAWVTTFDRAFLVSRHAGPEKGITYVLVPPVAWEVEINGLRCVVFAITQRKAQWIATKHYWNAFGRGRKGEWPRAKAWREPRHDNSALRWCVPPGAFDVNGV